MCDFLMYKERHIWWKACHWRHSILVQVWFMKPSIDWVQIFTKRGVQSPHSRIACISYFYCCVTNQPKTLKLIKTVIISHRFLGQEFGSRLAGWLDDGAHIWWSSISWHTNLSVGLLYVLTVSLLDSLTGFPQKAWSVREPHEHSTPFMPGLRSHTLRNLEFLHSQFIRSKWLHSTHTQMKGISLTLLQWRSSKGLWK